MSTDLPLPGLFGSLLWVFFGLFAANVLLFAAIVYEREQWRAQERKRGRIQQRLGPVTERLLVGGDPRGLADELRRVIEGLRRSSRPVAAWLVMDRLGGADEAARRAVCGVLEECGAVDLAERATRQRTPWRRALACEFLGVIGTERSVDVLVARLRDGRAEVRTAAALALGELGYAAAAQPLTELFLRREGVPLGVAHDALSRLGTAGAGAFRRGLDSPDATVRVTSCFGIVEGATGGGPEPLALLQRRLRDDGEPRVRAAAASAVQRLAGEVAPDGLLAARHDAAAVVRRAAARSLGAFGDPAAVEALADLLSDRDRETTLRAAESLLALADAPRTGEASRAVLAGSRSWAVESVRREAELYA